MENNNVKSNETNLFVAIIKAPRIGVFPINELGSIIQDFPDPEYYELPTFEAAHKKFVEGMNKQFQKILRDCQISS